MAELGQAQVKFEVRIAVVHKVGIGTAIKAGVQFGLKITYHY